MKPDIELESFIIWVTLPIWFSVFVCMAIVGAFNDWRDGR